MSRAHALKTIFVHPDCLDAVKTACAASDINPSTLVLISDTGYPVGDVARSIDYLVTPKVARYPYTPVKFAPGEAKSRTAFIVRHNPSSQDQRMLNTYMQSYSSG